MKLSIQIQVWCKSLVPQTQYKQQTTFNIQSRHLCSLQDDRHRLVGAGGFLVLQTIGWLFSVHPGQVWPTLWRCEPMLLMSIEYYRLDGGTFSGVTVSKLDSPSWPSSISVCCAFFATFYLIPGRISTFFSHQVGFRQICHPVPQCQGKYDWNYFTCRFQSIFFKP